MKHRSWWAEVAVDAVAELVVVVDGLGRVVYANRRTESLLGFRLEDWIGISGINLVHPGDVTMAAELIVSAQATGVGVKEPVLYRFRCADETWLEVEITATAIVESGDRYLVLSGRPGRPARPHADISDEIASRLSSMFDDAAIGMAQVTLDGRFIRANAQLTSCLGVDAGALQSRHLRDFVPDETAESFVVEWQRLVAGRVRSLSTQTRVVTGQGLVHGHLTASIVTDRFKSSLYVAVQILDVTDRITAEEALLENQRLLQAAQIELIHRSTHDALTGLGNRFLLESVIADLEQSDQIGSVSVVAIDLDGFKTVNDQHGHFAGDEVLIEVAARLATVMSEADTIVRIGGDEFIVVCTRATPHEIRQIVEDFLVSLQMPVLIAGSQVRIGASAGIATASRPTHDISSLLREADRALYLAKANDDTPSLVHLTHAIV